jgi:hypothetical protein
MKKKLEFLAMLICMLVLGSVLIGCPTDSDDGGSGTIINNDDDNEDGNGDNGSSKRDPALIGTWEETWETMIFDSDGRFTCLLMGEEVSLPNTTWSTSNGVISLDFPGRTRPETASYSISGDTLTTTDCKSGWLGNEEEGTPAYYTRKK